MKKIKFRLLAGKHHTRNGGANITYKAGDVVEFFESNIPLPQDIGLGRKWERITPVEEVEMDIGEPSLKVVESSRGWYDVVNDQTGAKINDKSLRKVDANALAGIEDEEENTEEPETEPDNTDDAE